MRKHRVLVGGYHLEIREMLKLNLRSRGFAVTTAAGEVQALSLVRDWQPHLIILDVARRRCDDFAVLPAFRRLTRAPIIVLAEKGDVTEPIRGLKAAVVDEYLAKPFEIAELLELVQTRLRIPPRDCAAD